MSERPIRQAASVIAVRRGVDGPDVLVVERGAASRFLPGYVVFPGGAVEEGDRELATRWFGDAAQGHRAAAVRELVEEAGLALTAGGLVDAGNPDSLDPVHAAPPPIERLVEVAHWVAPDDVPVRFDARYFGVVAPEGLEPAPDGAEAAHAWWSSPRELMREWQAGERKLYWPTYFTMTHLANCGSVDELLALRIETRDPTVEEEEILPRSVMEQD